jgi:hypothetical protein
MHIGDRVKVIKGIEEGIITRIVNDQIVEIEIQDGFIIPVHKKEIVVVSQKEAKMFGEKPQPYSAKRIISEKGLYVAFSGKDNELL